MPCPVKGSEKKGRPPGTFPAKNVRAPECSSSYKTCWAALKYLKGGLYNIPCLAKKSEKGRAVKCQKNQRCCGVGRILRHEKGFENTAVKARRWRLSMGRFSSGHIGSEKRLPVRVRKDVPECKLPRSLRLSIAHINHATEPCRGESFLKRGPPKRPPTCKGTRGNAAKVLRCRSRRLQNDMPKRMRNRIVCLMNCLYPCVFGHLIFEFFLRLYVDDYAKKKIISQIFKKQEKERKSLLPKNAGNDPPASFHSLVVKTFWYLGIYKFDNFYPCFSLANGLQISFSFSCILTSDYFCAQAPLCNNSHLWYYFKIVLEFPGLGSVLYSCISKCFSCDNVRVFLRHLSLQKKTHKTTLYIF